MLALSLTLQLALNQVYVTWTDADGVTHVTAPEGAPRTAKPIDSQVSVISRDTRAGGPPDGGVPAADVAWWDQRWTEAKATFAEAAAALEQREQELRRAKAPVCATATAEAVAEAPVVTIVNGRRVFTPSPPKTTTRVVEHRTTCREGSPTPSLVRERDEARAQLEAARRSLDAIRREALAVGVTWLL